jgi:hypothetical protein
MPLLIARLRAVNFLHAKLFQLWTAAHGAQWDGLPHPQADQQPLPLGQPGVFFQALLANRHAAGHGRTLQHPQRAFRTVDALALAGFLVPLLTVAEFPLTACIGAGAVRSASRFRFDGLVALLALGESDWRRLHLDPPFGCSIVDHTFYFKAIFGTVYCPFDQSVAEPSSFVGEALCGLPLFAIGYRLSAG